MSKITVVTGPMWSGKTSEFIRKVNGLKATGRKVGIFKPSIDIRDEKVKTRDGSELDYVPIPPNVSKEQLSVILSCHKFDVVAIDEVQFLDKNLISVIQYMSIMWPNIDFLFCGLNKDYKGNPFGPMGELLAMADDIICLKATCDFCHTDGIATRTFRTVETEDVILVGSKEYKAACHKCYVEASNK